MSGDSIRAVLDSLHARYSLPEYLSSDPVEFPRRCDSAADKETGALLSALFAYGNVKAMRAFLGLLFNAMGGAGNPDGPFRPASFLRTAPPLADVPDIASNAKLYYRFQSHGDVVAFLSALQQILKDTSGDDPVLERYTGNRSATLDTRLDALARALLERVPAKSRTPGLVHLVGRAERGLRKRYCMFLRWMVRPGFPDLGLYHTFDPRELVAPVDVHLMRLARNLGWVQRKTSTWETALAVTDSLRAICPEDPLKYDFALTRLGILKECRSEYVALLCERCDLRSICSVYAAKRPVRRQRNS